jgi:outer membrane lipoprotein-sorting protein
MKDFFFSVKGLPEYYSRFDDDHAWLRSQLMAVIEGQEVASGRPETFLIRRGTGMSPFASRAFRTAVAVAAAFAILLSVTLIWGPAGNNSRNAWAQAIQNTGQAQTVHFRMFTPGGSAGDSSVEVWWQRPDKFRMEFSNGIIMTADLEKRCVYNQSRNSLTISDSGTPGVEMALLGELGQLCGSDKSLSGRLIDQSRIINSTEMTYKGEKCYQVTSEIDDNRFEYVVAQDSPVLYKVKQYRKANPQRAISYMEVLEIDSKLKEDLFSIDPAGKVVHDRRSSK